jgi:phosphomevalonate kinase
VGTSTTTSDKVLLFQDWLSSQSESTADRIKSASEAVVKSVERAADFLEALRYFIEIQEFIDSGSRIGIWGPQHRAMKSLANREGVLYKPSGAGGGDIGLAISTDLDALDRLVESAEKMGLKEIGASIEDVGVTIEDVQ